MEGHTMSEEEITSTQTFRRSTLQLTGDAVRLADEYAAASREALQQTQNHRQPPLPPKKPSFLQRLLHVR
jgi:hypothetical protein